MLKLDGGSKSRMDKVERAAEKATFKNFGHAAARIMKDARASIETNRQEASTPGSPPHTKAKGGHNLRGAIRYDATKQDAVIGPMASFVGTVGQTHEQGGERFDADFPERPFIGPALEQNLTRFAEEWRGSITE